MRRMAWVVMLGLSAAGAGNLALSVSHRWWPQAAQLREAEPDSAPAAEEAAPAPAVLFADVESGPVSGGPGNLGVPIAIFGKGFGAERGPSRVTIGGVEVARYWVWGTNNAHNPTLDMIVVQPGGAVRGGPIVVEVNGRASNADVTFTPAPGAIYLVAPGGSDGNSCSMSSPCASILHVVADVMRPGDVLLVRGGTYSEGEIWIRSEQGGQPNRPKILINYPGEEVYLTNPARDLIVDANYVVVSGFHFRNGKSLAAVGWASSRQKAARFVNNTFGGNIAWAAIDTHGDDHLLAGNVCEVSGSSVGTMGHCYYVSQGSNLKILYNIASGAPGYGIHLYDERRETRDFQRVIRDVLVEGNILKNSTQRSGMIVAMEDQGNYGNFIENVVLRNNIFAANNHAGLVLQGISRTIKVYNNTFYQNGRQGIYIANDAKINGVEIRNNLFDQSPNSNCRNDCDWFPPAHIQGGAAAQNVLVSNNGYYPGAPVLLDASDRSAVTGAIGYVNAAGLDWHLTAGSAAIDRGVTLPAVPKDYDGRTRPRGAAYDLGAFEYETRTPVLRSVTNGASWVEGAVSPGSIVSCFGWYLGPARGIHLEVRGNRVATRLAETEALFDDVPAPLLLAQENQVTAVVPSSVSSRPSVRVEIAVGGRRSNAVLVPVAAAAPGIFTLDASGQGQGAILNQDGSLNSRANPAGQESVIVLYATGLGQTEPPLAEGLLATLPPAVVAQRVSVWVDGMEGEVLYAGTAPGYVSGLYQVNARLPRGIGSGDAIPVVVRVGGYTSQPGVTLAVQ